METTTTFVLGILCGSFLLGIIYGFIGIVRMKKSQKQLQATTENLIKDRDDLHRRIDEYINQISDYHNQQQRELDTRFDELHKISDDTKKYTDSRIDKTVDVLCQRMDIQQSEQKVQKAIKAIK